MNRMRFLSLCVIAIAASGCASAPQSGGASSRNTITGEELAASNARNVYDALERLRPDWLSARGTVSVTDPTPARANVYENGSPVGDLDYLRQVNLVDVKELRFYPPGAATRFGMGNPRGVIEIIRS